MLQDISFEFRMLNFNEKMYMLNHFRFGDDYTDRNTILSRLLFRGKTIKKRIKQTQFTNTNTITEIHSKKIKFNLCLWMRIYIYICILLNIYMIQLFPTPFVSCLSNEISNSEIFTEGGHALHHPKYIKDIGFDSNNQVDIEHRNSSTLSLSSLSSLSSSSTSQFPSFQLGQHSFIPYDIITCNICLIEEIRTHIDVLRKWIEIDERVYISQIVNGDENPRFTVSEAENKTIFTDQKGNLIRNELKNLLSLFNDTYERDRRANFTFRREENIGSDKIEEDLSLSLTTFAILNDILALASDYWTLVFPSSFSINVADSFSNYRNKFNTTFQTLSDYPSSAASSSYLYQTVLNNQEKAYHHRQYHRALLLLHLSVSIMYLNPSFTVISRVGTSLATSVGNYNLAAIFNLHNFLIRSQGWDIIKEKKNTVSSDDIENIMASMKENSLIENIESYLFPQFDDILPREYPRKWITRYRKEDTMAILKGPNIEEAEKNYQERLDDKKEVKEEEGQNFCKLNYKIKFNFEKNEVWWDREAKLSLPFSHWNDMQINFYIDQMEYLLQTEKDKILTIMPNKTAITSDIGECTVETFSSVPNVEIITHEANGDRKEYQKRNRCFFYEKLLDEYRQVKMIHQNQRTAVYENMKQNLQSFEEQFSSDSDKSVDFKKQKYLLDIYYKENRHSMIQNQMQFPYIRKYHNKLVSLFYTPSKSQRNWHLDIYLPREDINNAPFNKGKIDNKEYIKSKKESQHGEERFTKVQSFQDWKEISIYQIKYYDYENAFRIGMIDGAACKRKQALHDSNSFSSELFNYKSEEILGNLLVASLERNGWVIIDDLLNHETLKTLHTYFISSTIHFAPYIKGYMGSFSNGCFACGGGLLFEIANELKNNLLADLLQDMTLTTMWSFMYSNDHGEKKENFHQYDLSSQSHFKGIDLHSDDSDISINLWITPDTANLYNNTNLKCTDDKNDQKSCQNRKGAGGLILYPHVYPDASSTAHYNNVNGYLIEETIPDYIKPDIIKYKCNRMLIFYGKQYHKTDAFHFQSGFPNRRINLTFLYKKHIHL